MNISIIAGPLIGAVIGYVTNYLAVKMLFHPRREVKLFGKTLPFTPGVIPKGKARLAGAVGGAVGKTLLTEDDIKDILLSDRTCSIVTDKVTEFLSGSIREALISVTGIDEYSYERKKGKLADNLSRSIYDSIEEIDIAGIITDAAGNEVRAKLRELAGEGMMGSMISMMFPEDKIMQMIEPIGGRIEEYIHENGMSYIQPMVSGKIDEAENSTAIELLESVDIDREEVRAAVENGYRRLVENNIGSLMSYVDIASLIEDKINAMKVEEVEELVLSVMKKELDTIVRLGAVIGFLIGIVNVFI